MRADGDMAEVLRRNIEAMRAQRKEAAEAAPWPERLAERITGFAGSMGFVLLHLLIFGGWIVWNLLLRSRGVSTRPGRPGHGRLRGGHLPVDLRLISQNRMAAAEHGRAELDLQINLLAEHEITRLIDLVGRLAAHAGLSETDPHLDELRRDVAPDAVLDQITRSNEEDDDRGS